MSVWKAGRAARGLSLLVRPLCSNPSPPERPVGCKLMNFPPIFLPSILYSARNWIFSQFIIKPHLDPEFDIKQFVDGSKQAVEVISHSLSESDFDTLKELVSEEAYKELYESVSQMSVAEREELAVSKSDIYLCFPYQIGIMFEEDQRRWVEITMCYHTVKGLEEFRDSFGLHPDHKKKVQICNYRFIREYTKGVTNSSWVVNVVNQFKMIDFQQSL